MQLRRTLHTGNRQLLPKTAFELLVTTTRRHWGF
jgi:hypothetical protein